MESLKTLVKEYLYDTLYEADVVLRSSREKNITIVTDNLRGVCGITVCTVASPAKAVSSNVERTYLKIKFFKIEPTMQDQIARMSLDSRKIDGIHSFIVTKVGKVESRIYRPK